MPVSGPTFRGSAPPVSGVQSNRAAAWGSLSQRLKAFSAQEESRLDKLMFKKAKEQGRIDQQGKAVITLRDGETIADDAWNEGAKTSYLAAVKLDLTENLSRIENTYNMDQAGFETNAKAYVGGLTENADPAVRPLVEDAAASMISSSSGRISSAVNTMSREIQNADTEGALRLSRDESANMARDGDELNSLIKQDEAINFISSQVLSGMKKAGVAEKEIAEIELERNFELDKHGFSKAMENGTMETYLRKTSKSNKYSPDETDVLVKEMMSMVATEVSMTAAQDKLDKADHETQWDDGEREVTLLHLTRDLTTKTLIDMVTNGDLDPKVARTFADKAGQTGPLVSNSTQVLWVSQSLMQLTDSQIASNELLSDTDKMALIKERKTLMDDAANWRSSPGGREGYDRINLALKFNPNSILPATEAQYRIVGVKKKEFHRRVEEISPENRTDEVIVSIADEVVADQLVQAVDEKIIENDKAIHRLILKLTKIDEGPSEQRKLYEGRIKSLQEDTEALRK